MAATDSSGFLLANRKSSDSTASAAVVRIVAEIPDDGMLPARCRKEEPTG